MSFSYNGRKVNNFIEITLTYRDIFLNNTTLALSEFQK